MNSKSILSLIAVAGALSGRAAEPAAVVVANATNQFAITGMHCDGCAKGIAAELKRTAGVASASVTFSNQLATVTCDTNQVTAARLIKVVEEAGYKAKLKQP
jgi:copper chaperone CopZ